MPLLSPIYEFFIVLFLFSISPIAPKEVITQTGEELFSPVQFIPVPQQLHRPKGQRPVVHSKWKLWWGFEIKYFYCKSGQGLSQPQTSMMSVWNRKAKKFSASVGGGGRSLHFFQMLPWTDCEREIKSSWKVGEVLKWRGKCRRVFLHVFMCNFVKSTAFVREINVAHWMIGWIKWKGAGHWVWSQHGLLHYMETLVEIFQLIFFSEHLP